MIPTRSDDDDDEPDIIGMWILFFSCSKLHLHLNEFIQKYSNLFE
jgi:hypothetical protein